LIEEEIGMIEKRL